MRQEDLNPPGIVKAARALEEELAQKIKQREEKIVETTLEHARLQGEDLLRAKQHLGKRKFAPWLKSNFRFSRPTAYKYMRIARKWPIICKRGLQIATLEEVLRKLFGKAKPQTKCDSSAEAESPTIKPKSHRSKVEEPNNVTVPVEKIEAAADSTRVAADESAAADLTVQQQPSAERADVVGDADHAESQDETGNQTQKELQQLNPEAEYETAASNPKDALVMPIKDLRINEYFQGLNNELLHYHRKGTLMCGGIFPKQISEIMKNEDISVQLFLAVIQLKITLWKNYDERIESNEAKKTQKRERQKRK